MENAGRNAADAIRRRLRGRGPVAIVCGRGNNGGDGFVIARHLANAGIEVELFLACASERLAGDAATNHEIVHRMSLPVHPFDTADRIGSLADRLSAADVVVDAILGTGFSGDVRPPLDHAIDAVNAAQTKTVVAIDVPSGLDCDTGRPSNATIRAGVTITFVARKAGFDAPGASAYTGEILVADIGAPPALIREIATGPGLG